MLQLLGKWLRKNLKEGKKFLKFVSTTTDILFLCSTSLVKMLKSNKTSSKPSGPHLDNMCKCGKNLLLGSQWLSVI